MSTKNKITITRSEYDELLSYKQAFIDTCQLKKKGGASYEKYIDYKNMDKFFSNRYKAQWQAMKRIYQENKQFEVLDAT